MNVFGVILLGGVLVFTVFEFVGLVKELKSRKQKRNSKPKTNTTETDKSQTKNDSAEV